MQRELSLWSHVDQLVNGYEITSIEICTYMNMYIKNKKISTYRLTNLDAAFPSLYRSLHMVLWVCVSDILSSSEKFTRACV